MKNIRRIWWWRAAAAALEMNGGAGETNGRRWRRTASLGRRTGGAGRRRRGGLCSTKTKTKETAQIQGADGLYRGGPFSTGPWLEPVLKGL